jgi:hypothetical protein
MSKQPTLTDIVVADAAAAQSRAGNLKSTASNKTLKFERAKWQNFDPDRVIAVFDQQTGAQAGWLATDNVSIIKGSQLELETPPMLLSSASKLSGEGDAFKEIPKENKDPVIIQRAQAHFRAFLRAEVSDDMALIYPEWRGYHTITVDKIRRACRKLITDSFGWESSAEWGRYINRAMDQARDKIEFDGKKNLNDGQIKDRINKDPALKKEMRDLALEIYLKNAKYPFKQNYDKTTNEPLVPTLHVEAKVYATVDFDSGTYDNKQNGPDNTRLPSNNANLEQVRREMLNLPGKGGVGIDARTYEPINFINGMKKKVVPEEKEEKKTKKDKKRKIDDAAAADEKEPETKSDHKNKKQKKDGKGMTTTQPAAATASVVIEPDPFETRPTIALVDHEDKPILDESGNQIIVTDYFHDPSRSQNGRPIQSYVVVIAGLQMTASEIGGYGVKCIFKNKRQVKIIDYEDLPERQMDDYSRREVPSKKIKVEEEDDDSSSSSSSSDDEEDGKEGKTDGPKQDPALGKQQQQQQEQTTSTTSTSTKVAEGSVVGAVNDEFDLYDL